MEGRKQFTFYRSFYEAAGKLSKRKRLGFYDAIMAYALDGLEPELTDNQQKAAFILTKPVLDAGRKKALAGQLGASVTNRQKRGKEEKEEENENETENETEIEKEDECPGGGFEAFWELYPVKLGKDKAVAAWKALKPDGQAVCDGVRKWLQTRQWKENNGRFIPRAAKFLEERHYEHLPGDHIPVGASGALGKAELEAIAMVMGEK